MQRKTLFAGLVAFSMIGLAGVAAASDIQLSPFSREAQESGRYPAGTPAFRTVSPQAAGPQLRFVNREASEGLQGLASDPAVAPRHQTAAPHDGGPRLQFVNREASEGLQGMATVTGVTPRHQTVERAPPEPWLQFDQNVGRRGR